MSTIARSFGFGSGSQSKVKTQDGMCEVSKVLESRFVLRPL